MALGFVPLAQPQHMLWCCRDSTQWAALGLVCITELEGGLYPGVQMMLLLLFKLFAHLPVCVPVQACKQVVVEWFAGQPGGSLPFGPPE